MKVSLFPETIILDETRLSRGNQKALYALVSYARSLWKNNSFDLLKIDTYSKANAPGSDCKRASFVFHISNPNVLAGHQDLPSGESKKTWRSAKSICDT